MKQLYGIYWQSQTNSCIKKSYYTVKQAARIRQRLQHWFDKGRIIEFNITCLEGELIVIQINNYIGDFKHSQYDKPRQFVEVWLRESFWDHYYWLPTWQRRIEARKDELLIQ